MMAHLTSRGGVVFSLVERPPRPEKPANPGSVHLAPTIAVCGRPAPETIVWQGFALAD
jgi:hypothetical protein